MPSKLQDYNVVEAIGSGSYGTCKKIRRKKDGKLLLPCVFLVHSGGNSEMKIASKSSRMAQKVQERHVKEATTEILVWKELDYGKMTEMEKQMLVSEVNLLRELKHPHIVRYYDRIIDRTNTTIYIVMEFCDGGDLGAFISRNRREKRYPEEDFVWKILLQLVLAVQECHRRKDGAHVLHRDLKPANVFLDSNNNVKLGDFGLARVLMHDTSFAKTFVGTPYYMSPEQVTRQCYNEKSDIWSLGCLMYELCALSPPFTATNQKALEAKIRIGKFRPIPSHYSQDLSDLVSSMMQVREEYRPCIDELLRNPVLTRLSRETGDQFSGKGKEESLKRWEKELTEKEKDLQRRETILVEREKLVTQREEKVSRAEASLRHPYLDNNAALGKENEPELISRIGSRRNRPYDRDWREKLYSDEITAGALNGGRRNEGLWRLPELGYRNPNIVADKIRVERLLSGYR